MATTGTATIKSRDFQELLALEPTTVSAHETYDAILQAAEMVFRALPVESAKLTLIAGKAGCTPQAVYRYFPRGKTDIAMVVFYLRKRRQGVVFASVSQQLRTHHASGINTPLYVGVAMLVRAFLRAVGDQPTLDRHLLLHLSSSCWASELTLLENSWIDKITVALDYISQGHVYGETLTRAAFWLIYSIKGFYTSAVHAGHHDIPATYEEMIVTQVAMMLSSSLDDGSSCSGCPVVTQIRAYLAAHPYTRPTSGRRITDFREVDPPSLGPDEFAALLEQLRAEKNQPREIY